MSREAVGVQSDPHAGHVSILGADGPALVTMVDTSGRLVMWSHEGATLSPEVAFDLAEALRVWSLPKILKKEGEGK